eukprot:402353-Pyramimonas_sp.AAC.1
MSWCSQEIVALNTTNTLMGADTAAPALWEELVDCTLNGLPSPLNPFSAQYGNTAHNGKQDVLSSGKRNDALAEQLERILPAPYDNKVTPEAVRFPPGTIPHSI